MALEQNLLSLAQSAPINKKSGIKISWKWFFFLLIAASVSWWIYSKPHQTTETAESPKSNHKSSVSPVLVAKLTQRDINVYMDALGTITPRNTVVVTSLVSGQVLDLFFKEGQMVKKGQLLALIDTRPYEIQRAQAEGQLLRDKALLENAALDLARYKTLMEQNSIAKQALDTQESLVKQYHGTVAIDESQLENAKLQLSYCHITAPISGRVGLRQVDPGNTIQSLNTTGIATITQLQPITALFSLPEDSLPAVMLRMKNTSKVVTEAFDRGQKTKLASGDLLTPDNQIDTSTGSIKMRATFKNENNALFPNQFVNIKLLVDVQKKAIVMPLAALQRGKNGDYVYVVSQGNSVSIRPVITGNIDGEFISILKGLAIDDEVVIDGIDKLHEGAKIKIITPGETSGRAEHDPAKAKAAWHKKKNAN